MKPTWPLAVEVLASGGSIADAARVAKVTRQTLHNWLNGQPGFADAVADARAEMIDQATGTLSAACTAWAQTLADLATNPKVPAQFRIAAARAGLEQAARYRSESAIEERMRALEVAAGLRDRVGI